jgi:hypothetical protein
MEVQKIFKALEMVSVTTKTSEIYGTTHLEGGKSEDFRNVGRDCHLIMAQHTFLC